MILPGTPLVVERPSGGTHYALGIYTRLWWRDLNVYNMYVYFPVDNCMRSVMGCMGSCHVQYLTGKSLSNEAFDCPVCLDWLSVYQQIESSFLINKSFTITTRSYYHTLEEQKHACKYIQAALDIWRQRLIDREWVAG